MYITKLIKITHVDVTIWIRYFYTNDKYAQQVFFLQKIIFAYNLYTYIFLVYILNIKLFYHVHSLFVMVV